MPHEFKIKRRVEFAETDMAGIVHFSNFFRMMESTEHAFFRSLGLSIHSAGDVAGATGWPRVSAHCNYVRPLRFEDEVDIHLLVGEVRNHAIRYQFTFRKVADNSEIAYGSMTAVCARVDQVTRKLMPVAIPGRIREKITAAPAELIKSCLAPFAPPKSSDEER